MGRSPWFIPNAAMVKHLGLASEAELTSWLTKVKKQASNGERSYNGYRDTYGRERTLPFWIVADHPEPTPESNGMRFTVHDQIAAVSWMESRWDASRSAGDTAWYRLVEEAAAGEKTSVVFDLCGTRSKRDRALWLEVVVTEMHRLGCIDVTLPPARDEQDTADTELDLPDADAELDLPDAAATSAIHSQPTAQSPTVDTTEIQMSSGSAQSAQPSQSAQSAQSRSAQSRSESPSPSAAVAQSTVAAAAAQSTEELPELSPIPADFWFKEKIPEYRNITRNSATTIAAWMLMAEHNVSSHAAPKLFTALVELLGFRVRDTAPAQSFMVEALRLGGGLSRAEIGLQVAERARTSPQQSTVVIDAMSMQDDKFEGIAFVHKSADGTFTRMALPIVKLSSSSDAQKMKDIKVVFNDVINWTNTVHAGYAERLTLFDFAAVAGASVNDHAPVVDPGSEDGVQAGEVGRRRSRPSRRGPAKRAQAISAVQFCVEGTGGRSVGRDGGDPATGGSGRRDGREREAGGASGTREVGARVGSLTTRVSPAALHGAHAARSGRGAHPPSNRPSTEEGPDREAGGRSRPEVRGRPDPDVRRRSWISDGRQTEACVRGRVGGDSRHWRGEVDLQGPDAGQAALEPLRLLELRARARQPRRLHLNEQFVRSVQRPHARLQKLRAMVHFAQLHCRLRRQLLEWRATSRCLLLRDDEQDR
jgi:hypothetical protein